MYLVLGKLFIGRKEKVDKGRKISSIKPSLTKPCSTEGRARLGPECPTMWEEP